MKNLAKPIIEFGPVVVFFYFFIKTGEIQSAILPLMVAAGDPFFIKIKVTIVNLIFAGILYTGLLFKKPLLKNLMSGSLKMNDEGWFILSKRWAAFFLFLAICNEIVYRNFSDAFWVNFKLFGIMGLTFIFIFSQVFFIQKNMQQ